jgi:hypothetical protein
MTSRRVLTALSWIVGIAFIVLGLVEVVARVMADEPANWTAIALWSVTLLGGGALVLVGSFALPERRGLSTALVVAGCVLGVLGSAWTILLPILAIVLIFMRMRSDNAGLRTRA